MQQFKGWKALTSALAIVAATLASVAPANAAAGFGDVPIGEFYTEAVQWMVDEGITTGTSPGCFQPAAPATRGQVATFLHRFRNQPHGVGEPFIDVGPDDFFAEAVAWMASTGITTGVTPSTFEPDRLVTRGEVATFLHRAEGAQPAGAEPFADVSDDDFFAEPVAWMVEQGITTGVTSTTFAPSRPVTRAELAAFLYRVAGEPAVSLDGGEICPTAGDQNQLAVAEAFSFQLLNDLRAGLGLDALDRTGTMDSFARTWSATMDSSGDFEHSGGPYAENIAWWSAGSASPEAAAAKLHELWVNSPGHYNNMTRSGYDEVGVGFWLSEDGWHATHVFR